MGQWPETAEAPPQAVDTRMHSRVPATRQNAVNAAACNSRQPELEKRNAEFSTIRHPEVIDEGKHIEEKLFDVHPIP
jgi:hypothetical protein